MFSFQKQQIQPNFLHINLLILTFKQNLCDI